MLRAEADRTNIVAVAGGVTTAASAIFKNQWRFLEHKKAPNKHLELLNNHKKCAPCPEIAWRT